MSWGLTSTNPTNHEHTENHWCHGVVYAGSVRHFGPGQQNLVHHLPGYHHTRTDLRKNRFDGCHVERPAKQLTGTRETKTENTTKNSYVLKATLPQILPDAIPGHYGGRGQLAIARHNPEMAH